MFYRKLEEKKFNIKNIILFIFIITLFISSIIYLLISNNSINLNTRRKINNIEKDVRHLYNYTETISDFIVDNYKLPEINFEEFSLKNHMELKELNKNIIRKTAIEFLNKYYGLFNPNIKIYYTCVSDNLIDYFKLYEELLNIDYENFIVSFAYFSENKEENYKLHPIYKKINETIQFDYNFFDKYIDTYDNLTYSYLYHSYYKPNFIGQIPFKKICENINTYEEIYNYYYTTYYLTKIYNKDEYINKLFPSFISVSPQKFM